MTTQWIQGKNAMNVTKGRRTSNVPPSRKDKMPITFWLPRSEAMRLKKLAIDLDISINAVMEEATQMIFEKYDTAPSA